MYFYEEVKIDGVVAYLNSDNYRKDLAEARKVSQAEKTAVFVAIKKKIKEHKEWFEKNNKSPYKALAVKDTQQTPLGFINAELKEWKKVLSFLDYGVEQKSATKIFDKKMTPLEEANFFAKSFNIDRLSSSKSGDNLTVYWCNKGNRVSF